MTANYVELLGVIFSLLYLFFSIRQNILLWPMGIISAILYMVVFFHSKFYADMALNGYYLVISIYGWILWRSGTRFGRELPVIRLKGKLALILGVITTVGFFLIGVILSRSTDSPIPWWDALTTAVSFTATWMLARKILEHWIL
ncbi:MAG: nicotinamide mononucleotide transporter, partial [Bacteroidales bacterium]|nr:nicotinamide mononucleotide transporter [Bacteroidales bacterium]